MDTYQIYRPTAPQNPTAAVLKPDQDPNGLPREEYLIELKNYNQELRDCISREPRIYSTRNNIFRQASQVDIVCQKVRTRH
jgi:hypothetical protein